MCGVWNYPWKQKGKEICMYYLNDTMNSMLYVCIKYKDFFGLYKFMFFFLNFIVYERK